MGFLRILLAISVFLFHLSGAGDYRALDGGAAVFCFFVISGFYMELVLNEKYTVARLGKNYIKRFYLSRFWRLYPIYFIILVAVLVLTATLPQLRLPEIFHSDLNWDANKSVRFLINCFANASMLFLNVPSTKDLFIGASWSIGVEVSFYLLAPFILRMKGLNLLIISALGLFLQFLPFGQHAPMFFGIHFFILGALARRYHTSIETMINKYWEPSLPILYLIVLLMVFLTIPHEIYIGLADEHIHNSLDRLLYPVIVAALIPFLHERSTRSSFDFWVGQISYPFYLVHALVIASFSSWDSSINKTSILLVICIFISALLTCWEVKFIEPWRRGFSK